MSDTTKLNCAHYSYQQQPILCITGPQPQQWVQLSFKDIRALSIASFGETHQTFERLVIILEAISGNFMTSKFVWKHKRTILRIQWCIGKSFQNIPRRCLHWTASVFFIFLFSFFFFFGMFIALSELSNACICIWTAKWNGSAATTICYWILWGQVYITIFQKTYKQLRPRQCTIVWCKGKTTSLLQHSFCECLSSLK